MAVPLTLALIATSCTRGFDEPALDGRDSQQTVTGDEVVEAVGADGVRVELEGVATLDVPAGALPEGATVTLRRTDPRQPDGGMLELAGPAVDVSASAPLAGQVTLTLRFDRAGGFDELPAEVADVLAGQEGSIADSFETETVAVARLSGDSWELVGSQVDRESGTVATELDRLSTFAPVGGAVDRLADLAEHAWRAMLGIPKPDPPSCDPPPTVTVAGLGEWGCATVGDDGWLLVHIVNGQGFAVDLTLPDEAERVSAYHPRLSEYPVAVIGERLSESNVAWLPPAAGVSYRVPYDPDTTVRYEFGLRGSVDSAAATAVVYFLDTALTALGVEAVKEAVECGHQMGYVLDTDDPAWHALASLLWETAVCVGWRFMALLKSPLTLVQALLRVELELLERLVADLTGFTAWGATLTVTHDLPAPTSVDDVDVGALVDPPLVVDEVRLVELTGADPAELLIRAHLPLRVNDRTLEAPVVLVFSWADGDWQPVLNTATWPEGDPLTPLPAKTEFQSANFEAFVDFELVDVVDMAGDGTAELALATFWVAAASASRPLDVYVVALDADATPRLALAGLGDEQGGPPGSARVEGDTVVAELTYLGRSAACCPTGWTEYVVGWDGSRVAVLSERLHRIELRPDGLGVVSFGTSRDQTLQVLSRVLGEPEVRDERTLEYLEQLDCHGESWESGRSLWVRFDGPTGPLLAYSTSDPLFDSPVGLGPGVPLADAFAVGTVEDGGAGWWWVTDGPAEGMHFISYDDQTVGMVTAGHDCPL